MISNELISSLKRHEGWRDKAYQDSEGIWTIGYGRNLQVLQISKAIGEQFLRKDAETAAIDAKRFPEFDKLDTQARRDVFIEMVFNLGATRLAGFKNMLAAIREQDWSAAKLQMLDSKWARQVGIRAIRLADRMKNGEYE